MPERLSDSEVQTQLTNLSGWVLQGAQIEKEFKFKDFEKALNFVNQVGAEAQKMDHHPDLFLHDWNQVKISLSTHSAKGLTANDFALAHLAEKAATR